MAPLSLQLLAGGGTTIEALRSAAVDVDEAGVALVGEGCLDRAAGEQVRRRLAAGEVVIVLAQPESAAPFYPVPVVLHPVETHFADHRPPWLPTTIAAGPEIAVVGPRGFPDTPVVFGTAGTVVGSQQVGPGRLVFCQLDLCTRAAAGDDAGRAVLAGLIGWAGVSGLNLAVEEAHHADGRRVARYAHACPVAR